MKKEDLFDAVGEIRDEYIESAAGLLGLTEDETMHETRAKIRPIRRVLLIAAAIAAVLSTAALAAYFTISHRVPDAEETFPFKWDDSETGYLEWKDAKLVVTFPETAEGKAIEFRPGWLPCEMPGELPLSQPWSGLSKDTWFTRLTLESLTWQDSPEARDINQPLEIEVYAMPQFNDGGAMLMLYQTPGEITEEHWDDLNADALIFTAEQHLDAVPEFGVPERTITYHYVLLANAEEGWIVRVCGQLDRETIVKAAKNLEIRPTGETFTAADFDNRFLFFDGGVG